MLIGVKRQLVIEDGSRVVAVEIPVAMVRHVDECGRIGRGLHLDLELVVVGERVNSLRRNSARVALFSVVGDVGQLECRTERRVGHEVALHTTLSQPFLPPCR